MNYSGIYFVLRINFKIGITMSYKLFIACFIFLFSSIIYLINIKIITNTYHYMNFWWITLLTMSGIPISTIISCISHLGVSYKKYWKENIIRYPFGAGILYSLESVLLYYSISYVPLSTYMILRSSFIIWNIPFIHFLMHIPISKYYITSVCFILISTIFILIADSEFDNSHSCYIIIATGLLTASYNILLEKATKDYKMTPVDLQSLFQLSFLIVSIAPSIYYTVLYPPPGDLIAIVNYISIGLSIQISLYAKMYIMNAYVSNNVLYSSLEMIRRFSIIIISVVAFNEKISTIYDWCGIVCYGISSGFLLYDYVSSNMKPTKHVQLQECSDI
jgi:drug/metabolite transporter (DMT)-like permease